MLDDLLEQYPDIHNWILHDSYLDAANATMGSTPECEASVIARVENERLKTQTALCHTKILGDVMIPNEAGWVTNHMSVCLGQAIETELQDLYVSGMMKELFAKYQPTALVS